MLVSQTNSHSILEPNAISETYVCVNTNANLSANSCLHVYFPLSTCCSYVGRFEYECLYSHVCIQWSNAAAFRVRSRLRNPLSVRSTHCLAFCTIVRCCAQQLAANADAEFMKQAHVSGIRILIWRPKDAATYKYHYR